jgi:hypothetical protein
MAKRLFQVAVAEFRPTDSAKDKVECLYRLLVKDKLIVPLPADQENGQKHEA